MVFHPPSWVPQLPTDIPDSIPIAEFMRNEAYGRHPIAESRNPFTCGISNRTYSTSEFFQRSEHLSRALGKRLGWKPNEGTPWDKVVSIFSLNTVCISDEFCEILEEFADIEKIDFITAVYGVHRLSGIVTPANAMYSVEELAHQLKSSGAKAIITCVPLMKTALKASRASGIPDEHVFLFDLPGTESPKSPIHPTAESLINEGSILQELDPLKWVKGQGMRQPAFLCYSSGTSGLPKAVVISHYNVIANVLQHVAYESVGRSGKRVQTQSISGFLPFSHIYGLVVAAHTSTYRGDGVIVLPKFDFTAFLESIQRFKIGQLLVVPPIIIQMLQSQDVCRKYDLSSIRFVYSGAAPLGEETIQELHSIYPKWTIGQAYGMTETSVVVSSPSEHDIFVRASGSLLPGIKAKIIDHDGKEVTEYEKPGELLIQAPSVVLGYLNNEKATAETFVHHEDGRWIRTGDEALVAMSPSGNEQLVIVDRIKELIKVKGHQVAPAELEAHILAHPAVSDCAVIQIPDVRSGEVPKAFVVRSPSAASMEADKLAEDIISHVAAHKAPYKHIKGGVEFLDAIPKSPSGKILRRLLRDREKKLRRGQQAKLS